MTQFVAKQFVLKLDLMSLGLMLTFLDMVQFAANGYSEAAMIGSYHFYFSDAAIACLILALFSPTRQFQGFTLLACLAMAIIGAELVALTRGLLENPFQAFISFRYLAGLPVFCAVFVVTKRRGYSLQDILPLMAAAVIAILVLCVLRLIFDPYLFIVMKSTSQVLAYKLFQEDRILDSYSTVLIGCSAVAFAHTAISTDRRRRRFFYGGLAFATLVVVLLTRQRTATLASLAAFGAYYLAMGNLSRRLPFWLRAVVTVAIVCVCFLLLIGFSSDFLDLLPQSFQESFAKRSTFDARQEFWAAELQDLVHRGAIDKIFGVYAGRPTALAISSGIWETSLHNQYLQMLNNFGIVGVTALLLLTVRGFVSATSAALRGVQANDLGIHPAVCISWLVGAAIFGVAYEWQGTVAIFFVLACAPWSGLGRQRVHLPAPLFPRPRPVTMTPGGRAVGGTDPPSSREIGPRGAAPTHFSCDGQAVMAVNLAPLLKH